MNEDEICALENLIFVAEAVVQFELSESKSPHAIRGITRDVAILRAALARGLLAPETLR